MSTPEIEAAKGVVKQREAEAESAKTNLNHRKKQLERITELYKQKSVDERLVDEHETQVRSAESLLAAAVAAIGNAKADVEVKSGKS